MQILFYWNSQKLLFTFAEDIFERTITLWQILLMSEVVNGIESKTVTKSLSKLHILLYNKKQF